MLPPPLIMPQLNGHIVIKLLTVYFCKKVDVTRNPGIPEQCSTTCGKLLSEIEYTLAKHPVHLNNAKINEALCNWYVLATSNNILKFIVILSLPLCGEL